MGEFFSSVVGLFDQGGAVIWAILLISVYAVALCVERWLKYRLQEEALTVSLEKVSALNSLTQTDVESFDQADAAGRMALSVYNHMHLPKDERVEKVKSAFLQESADIEKHLNGISVSASILPMLGLLGTVIGMIMAFNAIAIHGTGDPKVVAGGISQALITTASGLVASIPLIYLHTLLTGRADRLIRRLDEIITHLLHLKRGD